MSTSISWTSKTNLPGGGGDYSRGFAAQSGVLMSGAIPVVSGNINLFYSTNNGDTWTVIPVILPGGGGHLIAGGGLFYYISGDANYVKWISPSAPAILNTKTLWGFLLSPSMYYGDGKLVVTHNSTRYAFLSDISTDSWSAQQTAPAAITRMVYSPDIGKWFFISFAAKSCYSASSLTGGWTNAGISSAYNWLDITAGAGKVVAISSNGYITATTNGTTWATPVLLNASVSRISYQCGLFFASGTANYWSADAVTWTAEPTLLSSANVIGDQTTARVYVTSSSTANYARGWISELISGAGVADGQGSAPATGDWYITEAVHYGDGSADGIGEALAAGRPTNIVQTGAGVSIGQGFAFGGGGSIVCSIGLANGASYPMGAFGVIVPAIGLASGESMASGLGYDWLHFGYRVDQSFIQSRQPMIYVVHEHGQ